MSGGCWRRALEAWLEAWILKGSLGVLMGVSRGLGRWGDQRKYEDLTWGRGNSERESWGQFENLQEVEPVGHGY